MSPEVHHEEGQVPIYTEVGSRKRVNKWQNLVHPAPHHSWLMAHACSDLFTPRHGFGACVWHTLHCLRLS